MEYVADAHAIVWHLFARQRLGKAAEAALDDAEVGQAKIFIPAVALAEVIMVVEKQRLPGDTMPLLEIELGLMQQSTNYEFLPLLPDLVIASRTLTAIPDIFDRLIVAEALHLNRSLISNDSVIRSSGLVNMIWD